MIDKFKKGGLNTSILAKIQLLPKELLQQVMQAFSQWALQKGVDIQKLQKDPNALEQALGQFMQELQSQKTQAARHGAKLNYLKSLKNKCAEDEELVYFKKGGSIDCGCKKKEVGGPIKKDSSLDARNKFIAKYRSKKEQARIDSLSEADYFNPNKKTEESSDRRTAEQKMPDSLKKKIIKKSCGGSAVAKFKAKCGSKLKKHQLGGSLNGIPFMQKGTSKGGIKRFSVSSTNGAFKTLYFDTEAEAKRFLNKYKGGTTVRRDGEKTWKGSPLKIDRTGEKATAYKRQLAEAQYNKLSFKDAYNLARKNNVRWFGYKGKVYKSDLQGKNVKDNLTEMEGIYGNNLGWSKDPKLNTSASKKAREEYRSQIKAKPNNEKVKRETEDPRKQAASKIALNFNVTDFVDAVFPGTAILNFIDKGISKLTGEPYQPKVHRSGLNIFGMANDLNKGNYGGAAFRAADAYLTMGAPGAGAAVDYLGTRFAPRLINLSTKSAYIPKSGTVPVTDETGNIIGRTLNPMAELAIRRGSGSSTVLGEGTTLFGQRSMLRAINEGVLEPFRINGGMNNAARYGNAAIQNNNTGTTYIFRNVDGSGNLVGNAYDLTIDRAVNGISPFLMSSEPVIQNASQYKQGGSLNGIPFYQEGTFKGGIQVPEGRTQEEVDAINTQNKNNAKGLFKGMISGQIVPTLPNIGRMVSSAYNGWVDPETTAITGAPTILPGRFPTIERIFGTRGGTYHILKKAPEIIKKMKLLTFMGNNGQQYVKTPDGKVQSLINYVGNIVEKDINAPYGKNMQKMLELEREKNALEVKNRFGTIGKLDYSLRDPAVNLSATRGSVNRIGGKYSNRNAQTANNLEQIESNLKRIPKGKKP